jgi:Ca2+-binding RTX toxin-like protein
MMRRAILLLTVMAATLVVASGVALAVTRQGGPGNDVVLGTGGPDDLGGGSGLDSILGFGGKDVLAGGLLPPSPGAFPPPEVGPNNDVLIGGSDNDVLRPNWGSDQILGGTGDDILFDGEDVGGSYDILIGDTGNDVLYPLNAPARQDLTGCGAGTDVAHVDRTDVVVGCERVLFRDATDAEFDQYLAERGLLGRV